MSQPVARWLRRVGPFLRSVRSAGARPAPLAPVARAARAAVAEAMEGRTMLSVVPANFSESLLAGGIVSPTAIEVAPDGRVFVSEQTGNVRVIKNGQLLAQPFLTVNEDSYFERGLFGVAFDPDFATNGHVYVYYTALMPGRTNGAADSANRVSRFTVDAANPDRVLAGSETVLYQTPGVGTAQWHMGGAIDFGPDGRLYVTVGEVQVPSHSQSLTTPFGKVLRINKDGTIPTGNPFDAQTTGINKAIWAMGLRNPFTAAFQPGTGRYYVNDVGQGDFEEINDGAAGANYGWPGTEGTFDPNAHLTYTNPAYAYPHTQGCSISGGGFYNPTNNAFPAQYTGQYFFADFCGGWIRTFDPSTKAVGTFATGLATPTGLTVGGDGAIYYISRGSGTGGTPSSGAVYRIAYAASQPPTLSAQPQDRLVSVGEPASFSVAATGSGPITYQWQRANGPTGTFANVNGATSSTYAIASTTTADNGARFRCVVTNPAGGTTSATAALTVTTNRRPTATITTPASGATYGGGQVINFAGSSTDPEQGALGGASFTWRVDFHHADHVHPTMADTTGSTSGSFTVPTAGHGGADVFYRIHLTVRDAGGLTQSTFRDVNPRLSTVTATTNVAGLRVILDGQPRPAPYTFQGIEAMQYEVEAPARQFANGNVYEFVSWSDGGARVHPYATPVDDATVTAVYREVESAGRYIEGESANAFVSPMNRFGDAGASGGQYAGTPETNAPTNDDANSTTAGTGTYVFSVPADGAYAIWARGMGPTDVSDSFWFRIDNGPWWLWDLPTSGGTWTWDQVGDRQPGGGVAPGSATLATLSAGNHTITIKVREDGARVDQFLVTRDTAFVPAAGSSGDASPPRIEQLYVAGSRWNSTFLNALGGTGYAVPGGSSAAQLTTLPWANLNQVKVKFSEPMNATTLQAATVAVRGSRAGNVAVTFTGYDATTRVATWTLANNATFGADKIRLVLPHTITDAAGTRLDGNWTTGQSFNSGNAFAGGAFDFRMNVVPGDADRDQFALSSDVLAVRGLVGAMAGQARYSIFADLNGDGFVLSDDVLAARGKIGSSLPSAEPTDPTLSSAAPVPPSVVRRTARTVI